MTGSFIQVIARCLTYPDDPGSEVTDLVRVVLANKSEDAQAYARLQQIMQAAATTDTPEHPSGTALQHLDRHICEQFTRLQQQDRVALIYGGPTKVKEYVFEAPRLPEIRGASALLEWLNDKAPLDLWQQKLYSTIPSDHEPHDYFIYHNGGNFLGFAPIALAQQLATDCERAFTYHTMTAKSVVVTAEFSLLELRYGRLHRRDETGKIIPFQEGKSYYWIEDFLPDCANEEARTMLLNYYYPEGVAPDDSSTDALRRRFFNRKKFGELFTELAVMFSRRRNERETHGEARLLPSFPLLPDARKCDSSDIRPAVYSGYVGDETRNYSEASARKRFVGQKIKRDASGTDWFTTHFDWELTTRGDNFWKSISWEQRWNKYLANEGEDTPYARECMGIERPPKDLSDIGAASNGYIGLIYADGNNVGRAIATCSTPQSYATLSKRLDEASKDAVFEALAQCLKPHRRSAEEYIHPFEILTIGGDDVFLIVPGNRAFDIALEISKRFERRLGQDHEPSGAQSTPEHAPSHPQNRLLVDRYRGTDAQAAACLTYTPVIGLSAGVVIAQDNAPIFFLRDLVEELLKQAKVLARDYAQGKIQQAIDSGGAIDFMVLKSITMVTDTISAFREGALGTGEGSRRRLTARPYTWHEFAGLLGLIRKLQQGGFPRSQLYRLWRVMDAEGPEYTIASTMEYLYTCLRMRNHTSLLKEQITNSWTGLVKPFKASAQPMLGPWLPVGDDGWETFWADVIEMYDMVSLSDEERNGQDND